MWQRTLRRACRLEGVGLHCGLPCRVTLEPAAEDFGIRFLRADLPGSSPIPASVDHVYDTRQATSLGDAEARVGTVEHLLAALSGCEVDNVLVRVEGPEIPVLDGSAARFVEAIDAAGLEPQRRHRRVRRLIASVQVGEGERWARLLPAGRLELAATIAYAHPLLREQRLEVPFEAFRTELAAAKTFGFLAEVEALRAAGLASGGSLENALVLGPDGWLNPEAMRFADEPVRHKLLDALGDLALFGGPVLARYEGYRAGHALHARLVQEAMKALEAVP